MKQSSRVFGALVTAAVLIVVITISFLYHSPALAKSKLYLLAVPLLSVWTPILLVSACIYELTQVTSHQKVNLMKLVVLMLIGTLIQIWLGFFSSAYLTYAFCIPIFNDIGALAIGRTLGKKSGFDDKIAPVLSPNKTLAGFMGGLATALVGIGLLKLLFWGMSNAFSLQLALPYDYATILALALVASYADLYLSAIKRLLDIKDFGHKLGGHGGWVDRFGNFYPVAVLSCLLWLLRWVVSSNTFLMLGMLVVLAVLLGGQFLVSRWSAQVTKKLRGG